MPSTFHERKSIKPSKRLQVSDLLRMTEMSLGRQAPFHEPGPQLIASAHVPEADGEIPLAVQPEPYFLALCTGNFRRYAASLQIVESGHYSARDRKPPPRSGKALCAFLS